MLPANRLRAASMLFAVLCASALTCAAKVTGKTDAVPPDKDNKAEHTDRHGDPLPAAAALMRLGTSRFRHGGSIYAVAYSADGKLLVTGNSGMPMPHDEASVVVWDAETGKRIRTWDGHAHVVRSVAFSADNKQIAVVNGYGNLHVFDVDTGTEQRKFATMFGGAALFTRDGKLVAAHDGIVRRWESATFKGLPPLVGHEKLEVSVTVAADGKTIAAWAKDGAVRVWDADGRERRRFLVPVKNGLVAGLSPDGKRLACGTFADEICLWDTEAGRELWRVKSASWRVSARAFSPDGKILLTGGEKLTLRDATTGKVLREIDGAYQTLDHVLFSPDGTRIVSAGGDAAPRFWDSATLKEILGYDGYRRPVLSAAFTPDGKSLATVSNDPFVHLWDLSSGKARQFVAGQENVQSISIARDGKFLATAGARGSAPSLWDLSTGQQLRRFESKYRDNFGGVGGGTVRLSADGKTLAASTGACAIRFWDAVTGKERPDWFQGKMEVVGYDSGQFPRFVVAPDGMSVATTRSQSPESGVILWDVASAPKRPEPLTIGDKRITLIFSDGADKGRIELAAQGVPAAFSPDGRLVAILHEKEVRLVDVATGVAVRRVQGDGLRVTCAAFSPDGKTLATAGEDRAVHLWETVTGKRRGQWAGHESRIRFVAFAPDGRRLASGGDDHTVLIWDLTNGASKGPLTAQECAALWTVLAGADAAKAYHALWSLSADATQALSFLKARLRPIAPADPKRLARLVADLDSDVFEERQQAAQELEQLSEQAAPALRQALNGKIALESRRRIEDLLRTINTQAPPPEKLRQLRSIEALEQLGTPEAREILQAIAAGTSDARLTQDAKAALERLMGS